MKLQKLLLSTLIFLCCFTFCFAQETPKAELFDEFGNIGCEDFLARLDAFFFDLKNNPNAQGYSVIYGRNNDLQRKIAYELWLNGAIKFRRMESLEIRKIRGSEAEEFKIQFWKVPAGAEKTDFKEETWDFTFPPKAKPFVFHDEFSDQICSFGSFEKVFVEYLNANSQSRGHIVIYAKSRRQFEKQKQISQDLLKNIDSRKLRFFFVKRDISNSEFWLVPSQKR